MKHQFTILLLLIFSQGFSQSTFRPATVMTENFCSEFDIIGHSTFKNNYSSTNLRFIRIQNTLSGQWTSAYCDCELCHDVATDSADFFIAVGDSCVTSAHFYPSNSKGMGTLKVKVFDPSNRSAFVVGEYTGSCWGASALFLNKEQIEVKPNPASTVINVLFGSGETYHLQVITSDGKCLMDQPVDGMNQQIDISKLPEGIYSVRIISSGKAFYTRFIKS